MSSVTSSNASAVPNLGQNKRSRAALPKEDSAPTSTPPAKPTVIKTPLAAALEMGMRHIVTLHEEAQPFLSQNVKETLGAFATFYWKQKKYKEMVDDPGYVPSSCRIGLTLNAVSEVKESEDFISLNAQLDAVIIDTQRTFAEFALRAFHMTQDAHLQRFKKKIAMLLPAAARIFGAEQGLSEYGEHQAVVDLLATHCDAVLAPLNTSLKDFLILYRDANELARIPVPTVLNTIYPVIEELNGPRPGGETSIQEQAATAPAPAATETTAPANATANANATASAEESNENLPEDQQTLNTGTTTPPPFRRVNNPYSGTPSISRGVQFTERVQVFGSSANQPSTFNLEDAMDEREESPTVMVGGKGVIIQMLLDLVQKTVHLPCELFGKQVMLTEKAKRIKKATRKPQLDETAERVAKIVNTERPVAPATLRGLVHEETVSNTAALQREVQSLRAKMDSLLVSKKKGGNNQKKKASSTTKSNQMQVKNRGVSSGKAGAKPATKQQAGDGAKDTTAASKKKRPPHSKSKSGGKKASSNKKKRS